jgi:putative membrane protein
MQLDARHRVRELTALLTVVSLALVVGAVRGLIPSGALPRVEAVVAAAPHLNALLSLTALGTIVYGVRAIRRGRATAHRRAMVTTTVLFLLFLGLYLYRIVIVGTKPFPGPEAVYQFLYLPVLGIHMLLAVVSIPLVYYVLLVATTRPVAAIRESPHPSVGRVAASLWFVAFALGIVVYTLLYVVY